MQLQPPTGYGILLEPFGFLQVTRLLWKFPTLSGQPKGKGASVIVFPGYGTDDFSTFVLRKYLQHLNYRVKGWGLGKNTGEVESLLPVLIENIKQESKRNGEPVSLIGWSMGGYLAREVARETPDNVRQVITFGSPVVGGPKYTRVAKLFERKGIDLDTLEQEIAARSEVPIKVPITVIYSKNDAIVSWEACRDKYHSHAEHHEVSSTHIGMGFSPEVYTIIARKLYQQGISKAPDLKLISQVP